MGQVVMPGMGGTSGAKIGNMEFTNLEFLRQEEEQAFYRFDVDEILSAAVGAGNGVSCLKTILACGINQDANERGLHRLRPQLIYISIIRDYGGEVGVNSYSAYPYNGIFIGDCPSATINASESDVRCSTSSTYVDTEKKEIRISLWESGAAPVMCVMLDRYLG